MTDASPRLLSLEIRGFRAFGNEPRVLQTDAQLIVIHAGNSQGKTSLAEAIEFLICGRSSRRELLGGAKAEYNESLRNAHMPAGDDAVYIEATMRGADGEKHRIRRELISDFGQGSECDSLLLLDGVKVADLSKVGLGLADPPVRAPVLLQHTLRHVLSTEPKQRVAYFKALLSLTDLDLLRDRVKAARIELEAQQPGAALRAVAALNSTSAAPAAAAIASLAKRQVNPDVMDAVDQALLGAGRAILGERNDAHLATGTVDDLRVAVRSELDAQLEGVFPLAAFAPRVLPDEKSVDPPDLSAYVSALETVDLDAARLAPVIEAMLAATSGTGLDEAVDCPVCGTAHALTPSRMTLLREQLLRTEAVDEAAREAVRQLGDARSRFDQLAAAARGVAPPAANWDAADVARGQDMLRDLGIDPALLAQTHAAASDLAQAANRVATAADHVRAAVDQHSQAVSARRPLPTPIDTSGLAAAQRTLSSSVHDHSQTHAGLRAAVEAATRGRGTVHGLAELAAVLACRSELAAELASESRRQRAIKRTADAERSLRDASSRVLDERFALMSDAITSWWSTIRPEELVGFGGIKRRAGGALFVNLVAALRADPSRDAVERDALGVYSDSQLNALGLSIFLARAGLLGSPLVVLDDPIPGSDADHRLTFVQNTLSKLLDTGIQVVLTTFDSKLAEWAQTNHDWRGSVAYELNLVDAVAGTEPTQTSDTFSRLLLEAADNLNAPTSRGRRAACVSLRSAAERLAKQVIATGRTSAGQPTTVDDVDAEASVLGNLVPLVTAYAIDNAEKGQWRTFAAVLNPGGHDDDVPPPTALKQVRSNLRKIEKSHRSHWTNGLIR
jgi:hypothetical protein